jgi:hypothetical protein
VKSNTSVSLFKENGDGWTLKAREQITRQDLRYFVHKTESKGESNSLCCVGANQEQRIKIKNHKAKFHSFNSASELKCL